MGFVESSCSNLLTSKESLESAKIGAGLVMFWKHEKVQESARVHRS